MAAASAMVIDEHIKARGDLTTAAHIDDSHWIVHVQHGHNDEVLTQLHQKAGNKLKVKYNWKGEKAEDLHALSVKGISLADAQSIEGVMKVHKVNRYEMTQGPMSWGLDRIDQANLPLSESPYNPAFNGCGVDVYVLDTGIDTNHPEFGAGPYAREVRNIWDVYR
ncbi:hypothetical protein EON64_05000 [archaeon]|nr:MAG: hypothetical protein EON64_05000 [archaeon]